MPFLNCRISFFVILIYITMFSREAYLQEKVLEVGEELKYEL